MTDVDVTDKHILLCPRCGSAQTRLIKGGALDRALALMRGQQVIVCGRCGWRGRQMPVRDRRRSMRLEGAAVPPADAAADSDVELLAAAGDERGQRPRRL